MAEVHGKDTVLKLNAVDISAFSDTCTANHEADEHDSSAYGSEGHEVAPGLKVNGYTIGGKYVNGAAGPRQLILSLVGTKVVFIYQSEGTGAGLPQESSTVHVKKYNQSSPVADIVRWTAELTTSGVVDYTAQA